MDMPSDPVVSVIVVTARDGARLARCLETVQRAEPELPLELIVVLNAADPGMDDAARAAAPDAQLVASDAPLGFAGGTHLGADAARGRFLHVLHDDAIVEPGAISALVQALEAEPRAGAAGSMLVDPDGQAEQACGWALWRDGRTGPAPLPAELAPVDYCSSASLMVRADAWRAVGGFDEELHPAQFVDVDLAMRLRASGRLVIGAPQSRVRHASGGSTTRVTKRVAWERNRERFLTIWANDLAWQEPFAEDAAAQPRAAAATARRAEAVLASPLTQADPAPARTAVERELAALRRDVAYKDACLAVLAAAEDDAAALRADVAVLHAELANATSAWEAERRARLHLEPHYDAAMARLAEQDAQLAYLRQREGVLEGILAGRWWRLRELLRR